MFNEIDEGDLLQWPISWLKAKRHGISPWDEPMANGHWLRETMIIVRWNIVIFGGGRFMVLNYQNSNLLPRAPVSDPFSEYEANYMQPSF